MTKIVCRPFRPYVSLEQVFAFRPGVAETRTGSPLVDEVLRCFEEKKLRTAGEIGRYLRLDARALSCYLQIATGYGITELRRHWTLNYAERYAKEHPHCKAEEMAEALGFKDRSSLWQSENQERLNRKQQQRRKLCAERSARWVAEMEARMETEQKRNKK